MSVMEAASMPGVTVRPYNVGDAEATLELIWADQLPGQPKATAAMLADALVGRSPVDQGWWDELDMPCTDVAVDINGRVLGVVSYARHRKENTGVILWLHCREAAAVADALVAHALAAFPGSSVHAFDFSSALTLSLEALPVRHRPVTRAALERAGFVGKNEWRYMRVDLPLRGLPSADRVRVRRCPEDERGRRLVVRRGWGRTVAKATVILPVQGIGLLGWIEVAPAARGRGFGRALLGSALELMAQYGAREAILYVDDYAPPGEESERKVANALYDSAGFVEVDRLYSFLRGPQ